MLSCVEYTIICASRKCGLDPASKAAGIAAALFQIEFNEAFTSFRKEQREDLKREVEELKKQLKELANSTNNSKEVVKTDNDSNS